MIKDDADAWQAYPDLRLWFNKLWVAENFGYLCGPGGVAPPQTDTYIVKPIYNLSGMGVGAHLKRIEAGDTTQVAPGYFWCEYFIGEHYSIDYKYQDGQWVRQSVYTATKQATTLQFNKWTRYDGKTDEELGWLDEFNQVDCVNVEYIRNMGGWFPFDIHFRQTPDNERTYNELVPLFANNWLNHQQMALDGYKYVEDYDDADGFLSSPRMGFYVR